MQEFYSELCNLITKNCELCLYTLKSNELIFYLFRGSVFINKQLCHLVNSVLGIYSFKARELDSYIGYKFKF